MDSDDYAVCEICKRNEVCLITQGFGLDTGMATCEDGHIFCSECVDFTEVDVDRLEDGCELLSKDCPICQRDVVTDEIILEYLIKQSGKTKEELSVEITNKEQKEGEE